MAQTGRPGGRQSLENKRVQGDIHAGVPSVGNAKSISMAANTAQIKGTPNTNRHKS
jgi:hypothetical protein